MVTERLRLCKIFVGRFTRKKISCHYFHASCLCACRQCDHDRGRFDRCGLRRFRGAIPEPQQQVQRYSGQMDGGERRLALYRLFPACERNAMVVRYRLQQLLSAARHRLSVYGAHAGRELFLPAPCAQRSEQSVFRCEQDHLCAAVPNGGQPLQSNLVQEHPGRMGSGHRGDAVHGLFQIGVVCFLAQCHHR